MRNILLLVGLVAACGSPEPATNDSARAAPVAPPAAAAAGAIPPAFHGVYDASREACTRPSEYRLTVTARELRFHESIGVVRKVIAEGADAVRIAADFQGEGESWRAVQQLRLADDGSTLAVSGPGTDLIRRRCG